MSGRGNELRSRLDTGAPLLLPGVWDPLSCRLAADAGFAAAFLSGYCVSATLLGLPDIGYLTQTEMAEAARRCVAAQPDLLLVVDGDTGYGNPLNAIRTVGLWEHAGAAGIFLEDQVFPKRCGHMSGKQVVPVDDWLANLRAAVEHRSSLFVVARTDARATDGLDEAIRRAHLAADVGVDALFIEAPESIDELEQIAGALKGRHLVANMVETGLTPLLTPDELSELGFSIIVSPLTGLFAATAALRTTYRRLHAEGSLRSDLAGLATFDEFAEVIDLERHRLWEADARGD